MIVQVKFSNYTKLNYNILLKSFDIIKKEEIVELWKVHIELKCFLIMYKYLTYNSFNLARYQELLKNQNYWLISKVLKKAIE